MQDTNTPETPEVPAEAHDPSLSSRAKDELFADAPRPTSDEGRVIPIQPKQPEETTPLPVDENAVLDSPPVEVVPNNPEVTFQEPVESTPEPVEHEHYDNPSEYDSSDREPDYDAAEVNPKEPTE